MRYLAESNIQRQEEEWRLPEAVKRRLRSNCLIGTQCQFSKMTKFGDGQERSFPNNVYGAQLNLTLKNGYNGNFYVIHTLPQLKKKV